LNRIKQGEGRAVGDGQFLGTPVVRQVEDPPRVIVEDRDFCARGFCPPAQSVGVEEAHTIETTSGSQLCQRSGRGIGGLSRAV
jgi:hypothetical protein